MDMIPILILIITYLVISSWSVFTTIVNPQLEKTKNYWIKTETHKGLFWQKIESKLEMYEMTHTLNCG